MENATGLSSTDLALRGGMTNAHAYSSVSRFGTPYKPLSENMNAVERVEALVEGSPLSLLHDTFARLAAEGKTESRQTLSKTELMRQHISRAVAIRPTRSDRFMGDPEERGGTVVVHYIKRPEWFVETMVALLGTADEQSRWYAGAGAGSGVMEVDEGRMGAGGGRGGWKGGWGKGEV